MPSRSELIDHMIAETPDWRGETQERGLTALIRAGVYHNLSKPKPVRKERS